jgi:hypothetical protein
MAHISSIGAGLFSDLSIHVPSTLLTAGALAALTTAGAFNALFTTAIESVGGTTGSSTFVRVRNVREYPQIGTPANVVNVPSYGQKTSSQIQGQADAPSLEVTLNFVPSDWGSGTSILGGLVGNGNQYVFRFAMLNSEPTGATVATKYASSVAGLGSVQNSVYYWVGKVEALLANPQLTDANQATLTMTLQGDFYGAYTL